MMELTELETQFADALKSIARREDFKAYIGQNPLIYRILRRAAAQYVTGDRRIHGLEAADRLQAKGYAVSLEYIGENTANEEECKAAVSELLALIGDLRERGTPARVSFDLSHIGLSLDTELAAAHLLTLAETALQAGIELFISMEESAKTDKILSVYEGAAARYPNIGITLQAYLHRTAEDLSTKLPASARVRIVKGAYQEADGVSIPRSEALDDRYLELVELAVRQGNRVSVATHDERLIEKIIDQGWYGKPEVEFEMLYGIRPDLSGKLKAAGHPVRIYLTYGHEWYLYLCHRVAEYPPNIYRAIAAMINEESIGPAYS
ncbi:proline dehydrogenase family protein [Paenibacillus thailandensis]|uniref:proline dehydrogenase n=1 Tax=Paenibacillus thailandensis TaxID=393250 RepID=A0ABW5QUH4_9BACL